MVSGDVTPAERAETWLRLLAEAELREALKTPKSGSRSGAGWASTAVDSPAMADPPAGAGGRPALVPAAAAIREFRPDAPIRTARRRHGLRRLSLAADILVATAGVEPEHADAIVRAHELSLAFRRRMSGGPFGFGWVTSPRPTLRQHQAGPFTAISIGERVPVTVDSRPAEVFLLALVSSPQRAEITYPARLPPLDQPTGARDEDEEDDRHLIVDFFSDITVTDDHLGSYDLSCASDDYDGGLLTGRFCQGKTALPGRRRAASGGRRPLGAGRAAIDRGLGPALSARLELRH